MGQVVPSVITKLVTFGAFARLDGPVEGLIHVSELVDRRISHPREVISEEDVVPVKIVRIERDRHRLGLSLRQARPEAEGAGWVFNEAGGILAMPPAVAEAHGIEVQPAPPPAPAAAAGPRRRAAAAGADHRYGGGPAAGGPLRGGPEVRRVLSPPGPSARRGAPPPPVDAPRNAAARRRE